MDWTKGTPIGIDGYFWMRFSHSPDPVMIEMKRQRMYETGVDSDIRNYVNVDDCEFLGPITPSDSLKAQMHDELVEALENVNKRFRVPRPLLDELLTRAKEL